MVDWPVRQTPTFEAALRDIRSPHLQAQLAAIESLANVDESQQSDARDALREALDSSSSKVRAQAALALAELGPGSAIERLEKLAIDPDGRVAQAAVIALGESNDRDVVPTLKNALTSEDPDVRFQAVLALARVAGVDAYEELSAAADDVDAEVRANVAAALADLRCDDGVEVFLRLLDDVDASVRLEAALALAARGDRRAVPHLIMALQDAEAAPQAVRALGVLKDPSAAEPLRQLCTRWTARAPLRAAAAAALAALDDPFGRKELDRWLQVRKREPRAMAIYSSGELALSSAVDRLVTMLGDSSITDRDSIARALGQIGDPMARSALESATKDPDPDVVNEATLALEALNKRASDDGKR